MTDFEILSLVISGFAAVGTVGAVIIALWATLHKRVRYKVKSIRVGSLIQKDKPEENSLYIMFENRLPVQMEIHAVELEFTGKRTKNAASLGWTARGEFIPAHSQYEVKFPLKRGWESSIREREVRCITRTSAGDTVTKFPNEWKELLYRCLEIKEVATDK